MIELGENAARIQRVEVRERISHVFWEAFLQPDVEVVAFILDFNFGVHRVSVDVNFSVSGVLSERCWGLNSTKLWRENQALVANASVFLHQKECQKEFVKESLKPSERQKGRDRGTFGRSEV